MSSPEDSRMRIKKPALVVTFATAAEAMKMEKYCLARNLPGRLIPTPQEISAGCGLAWKAPEDARELLVSAMTEGKIRWEDARVLTI